jgi:hypothetical protein
MLATTGWRFTGPVDGAYELEIVSAISSNAFIDRSNSLTGEPEDV